MQFKYYIMKNSNDMTVNEILIALENFGDTQTKKTLIRHGAKEPLFGVKVADLKKILQKTKKNHELSLALYNTGNSDAMYLAGLMADETKITQQQLEDWLDKAYWSSLNEFAVPWVASETKFGFELGQKWIQSNDEKIAAAGWATLSCYAAVTKDEDLNIDGYSKLLDVVESKIHNSKNRVKYTMNNFVIAIASYIQDLTEKAQSIARKIDKVEVNMNGTACKVPFATEYIEKNIKMGRVGKKKKTARC